MTVASCPRLNWRTPGRWRRKPARRALKGRAQDGPWTVTAGLERAVVRDISKSLSSEPTRSEVVMDAVNRRGRAFECWVKTMPLVDSAGKAYGVIVLMADRQSVEAEGLPSLQD